MSKITDIIHEAIATLEPGCSVAAFVRKVIATAGFECDIHGIEEETADTLGFLEEVKEEHAAWVSSYAEDYRNEASPAIVVSYNKAYEYIEGLASDEQIWEVCAGCACQTSDVRTLEESEDPEEFAKLSE